MSGSLQIPELANRIAEYIRSEHLPRGARLTERKLAERFRVSRSPIVRALRLLEEHSVVSPFGPGGYAVCTGSAALPPEALGAERHSEDEQLYLRLAQDHTAGQLPARASESELIRRYGASRATIVRIHGRV